MNWLKRLYYNILREQPKIIPRPDSMLGGAKKSKKDKEDYKASGDVGLLLSPEYRLWSLSKVENQGGWNSCVSHAITTSVETFAKTRGWPNYLELSRLHLWNEAKQLTWGEKWHDNSGVYIRDGWRAAKKGVTIEKLFPYNQDYYYTDLHDSWVWKWYPSFSYWFIRENNLDERERIIKEVISYRDVPVVFGIRVPNSFKRPHKGVVYKPLPSEPLSFSHSMLIVGWDDKKNAFLILNSWGTRWGDKGFLYVDRNWVLGRAFDLSYPDDDMK